MISLRLAHTWLSMRGSLARYFQKLLTSSTLRVALNIVIDCPHRGARLGIFDRFHGLDFLVAGKHNASLLSLRKGIWGPLSFSPYCESIKNALLNQGRTGMILRFVAAGLAAALLASPIAFAGDETGRFVIAQADTDT